MLAEEEERLDAREPVSEREKWNRRYRESGPEAFGEEPTPWLVENLSSLPPSAGGRALDLACGYGRNTLYLARLGYAVDAVDVSDVAVDHLRGIAGREGLDVEVRRADLRAEPRLPAGRYQVALNFRYLDRRLFAPLAESLAPGGVLLFETFTRADAAISGRSFPPELLLAEGELRDAFPTLTTLAYREVLVEDRSRCGQRAVASLVARR